MIITVVSLTLPGWSLHFKVETSVTERMRGAAYREHSAQRLGQDGARSLLTIIFFSEGGIFGKPAFTSNVMVKA